MKNKNKINRKRDCRTALSLSLSLSLCLSTNSTNLTNLLIDIEKIVLSMNRQLIDSKVLPGDMVGSIDALDGGRCVLARGIFQQKSSLIATKAGILRYQQSRVSASSRKRQRNAADNQNNANDENEQNDVLSKYWIENTQKRYVPLIDDMVVGCVLECHAEEYRVDIGGASTATLNVLAFEGATKKNRPRFDVGTLVYARVVVANKDMEPELSCVAASGRSEGFGQLDGGGYCFSCSLHLCRNLMHPRCAVLHHLGTHLPFELAVGLNGRVWVNGESVESIVLLVNALLNSEHLSDRDSRQMIDTLLERYRSDAASSSSSTAADDRASIADAVDTLLDDFDAEQEEADHEHIVRSRET
jgi:exosome complex component RRP40